jgi:hypothetical protein
MNVRKEGNIYSPTRIEEGDFLKFGSLSFSAATYNLIANLN